MDSPSSAFFLDSDVPDGWAVCADQTAASNAGEIARLAALPVGSPESGPTAWGVLETEDGKLRALVSARQEASTQSVSISAVLFWSTDPQGRVTGADLRKMPLAELEGTVTRRKQDASSILRALVQNLSEHPPAEFDREKPVGRNDGSDSFFARVALAWRAFEPDSEHPTAELARANGVSLRTAQDWVTKARERQFLAPGRRGRAK